MLVSTDRFGKRMGLCRVHRLIWETDGACKSARTDLEKIWRYAGQHRQTCKTDGAMQVYMKVHQYLRL